MNILMSITHPLIYPSTQHNWLCFTIYRRVRRGRREFSFCHSESARTNLAELTNWLCFTNIVQTTESTKDTEILDAAIISFLNRDPVPEYRELQDGLQPMLFLFIPSHKPQILFPFPIVLSSYILILCYILYKHCH